MQEALFHPDECQILGESELLVDKTGEHNKFYRTYVGFHHELGIFVAWSEWGRMDARRPQKQILYRGTGIREAQYCAQDKFFEKRRRYTSNGPTPMPLHEASWGAAPRFEKPWHDYTKIKVSAYSR